MWNGCHGMRGVVGGLVGKASQKLTQAFPDLSVQFASPPPSSGMSAIWENAGRIVDHLQGIDTTMKQKQLQILQGFTNTSWRAETCNEWHSTLRARNLNSWAQSFRNPQHTCCIGNTHAHVGTKASCAQSIVVTIIQHMWLICPWQYPSGLGDDLQREMEQNRGGHMTSPNQTIAATNTQDKCQHFDQSSLPFCFYQHAPVL